MGSPQSISNYFAFCSPSSMLLCASAEIFKGNTISMLFAQILTAKLNLCP